MADDPTQPPARTAMPDWARAGDAVRLSSSLTYPYRVFTFLGVGVVCALPFYAWARGFPLGVVIFFVLNDAIGIWLSWPYLFLEDAWLWQSELFMGPGRDAVDMSDIDGVTCTRVRPHVVCIKMGSGPRRKRWFMPKVRFAPFGGVHPIVHTLGGLAAQARPKRT
jgi:hypothetical protein